MAYPFQMGIQDATSPITEELLHFHVHTLMMMFLISSLVLYMLLPCSLHHFINTNY